MIAEEQEGSSGESVDFISRIKSVPVCDKEYETSSEAEESDYRSSASEKEKPNSLKD